MLGAEKGIQMQIFEHLRELRSKFHKYFPQVNMIRDELSFTSNPFKTDVYNVPENLQEEFLEPENDLVAQGMC